MTEKITHRTGGDRSKSKHLTLQTKRGIAVNNYTTVYKLDTVLWERNIKAVLPLPERVKLSPVSLQKPLDLPL